MQYGICHLSSIPVRSQADEAGEMLTQILYGEHFKVLENRKFWSKIRVAYDGCEGWIVNQQFLMITEEDYLQFENTTNTQYASDLVSFVTTAKNVMQPILLGSCIQPTAFLEHTFEGNSIDSIQPKENLIRTALMYLNAPYLWGGKTPFGIDAAGFTQMVYKINGYQLLRNAPKQATQGEALSFIEESEAGDLAFFDNKEGEIDHVGIIMQNNYIIHASGTVRIDRIDHTGIFNTDLRNYTHQLRVIKKII